MRSFRTHPHTPDACGADACRGTLTNMSERYTLGDDQALADVPRSVTWLMCNNTQLTSLQGCPPSLTTLYCSRNQLTSLEGCPQFVTTLYCVDNQLTSFDGCPPRVTTLNFENNRLTSVEGCPLTATPHAAPPCAATTHRTRSPHARVPPTAGTPTPPCRASAHAR